MNEELKRLRRISWLIGSIYVHGGFVAETANERELESLLRAQGTFWDSLPEFEVQIVYGGGDTTGSVCFDDAPQPAPATEWQASTPEQLGEILDKIAPSQPLDMVSSGGEREAVYGKVIEAIRLADKVGRSRQENNYAMDKGAVDKLVELESEIAAMLQASAAHRRDAVADGDGDGDGDGDIIDLIAAYRDAIKHGTASERADAYVALLAAYRAAHRREDQRDSERADIGRLLHKAACELPDGWEIQLRVERGWGGVVVHDDAGETTDLDDGESSLSEQIERAIDAAMQRTAAPAHGENGVGGEGQHG